MPASTSASSIYISSINSTWSDHHDQLLVDVRHITCPQPKSVLGIPQLDDLLEYFRYPDEPTPRRPQWVSSGAPSPEDHAEEYDSAEGLTAAPERTESQLKRSKPATIEITSRQSASGKTHLFYYLATLATLPREVGGKQSAVVWIDNDGRFSASRMLQVLRHHLLQSTVDNTSEAEKSSSSSSSSTLILEALIHMHIFRPNSSSQILSILESLPSYLLDQTRHKSSPRPLGLLVIDSATAFYAQDRFDADMARLDAPLQGRDSTGNYGAGPSKTAAIIAQLREVQARFGCVVLFSTNMMTTNINNSNVSPYQLVSQEPSANSRAPPGPSHPTMPTISPWTHFATLTLQLERVRIPQFAPQMSLEQCLHDAERRLEVVRRGRFVVSVLHRNAVGLRGKGKDVVKLVLRVVEDGVVLE